MKYRHEIKHEISKGDMLILRSRLKNVMKTDAYAHNGKYLVRSLYFDNLNDKALREKQDGVNIREKFRIRYYNNNTSLIHLEKKSKVNGLCLKQSAVMTREMTEAIINGDYSWMLRTNDPLILEFYYKIMCQGLRPKTVVDYTREPFVFKAGNVRVTLDYDIRTSINCKDFLKTDCVTVPVGSSIVLEVKWDEFLPDIIRGAVTIPNCRAGAFSKYATCRMYD